MDPKTYFYLTNFIGIFVIGLLIFLIGLFVAWILWRNRRAEVEEIERENAELQAKHDALEHQIAELEAA